METFKLECGHVGKIIWTSDDGETIGVQGAKRGCPHCGKYDDKGAWIPTIHLISSRRGEAKKEGLL